VYHLYPIIVSRSDADVKFPIVRLSELKDEVKNSAEWKQKEEENKEFLKQLASVFGEKKISLSKVSGTQNPISSPLPNIVIILPPIFTAVYHVVNSEEIHHQKQIPGLTQEMKAKIAEIKDWVVCTSYNIHFQIR
jgi:hypothetical protein